LDHFCYPARVSRLNATVEHLEYDAPFLLNGKMQGMLPTVKQPTGLSGETI